MSGRVTRGGDRPQAAHGTSPSSSNPCRLSLYVAGKAATQLGLRFVFGSSDMSPAKKRASRALMTDFGVRVMGVQRVQAAYVIDVGVRQQDAADGLPKLLRQPPDDLRLGTGDGGIDDGEPVVFNDQVTVDQDRSGSAGRGGGCAALRS